MNTHYVAGFMFSIDFKKVALIRKNRPAWQAGKLNGVGGHIEQNELPACAMHREFIEETGYNLPVAWEQYARISDSGCFSVTFFATTGELDALETTTDETVEIVEVEKLSDNKLIDNLPWLIPLAIDFLEDGRPIWTEVNYPSLPGEG